MKRPSEKLPRLQERVIAALLSSATLDDAAKAGGVSKATVWRWLQHPEFQIAFRAARRQVVERAIATLQQASGEAVETLRRNLRARKREGVQVRAALGILDHAIRAIELMDLEERVTALEARVRVESHQPGRAG